MEPLPIRPAVASDLPALLEIYNEVIAHSTAVFAHTPATLAERTAWYQARLDAGFPVLVAEAPQGLAGFATFGEFRASPGYRYCVEHTVHVHTDWRGQGVGKRLVQALFPLATDLGKHIMIGAVDAANEASLRMHERLGFARVAHLREAGRKFERWLDLVLVQRFIDAPGSARTG
jgi:L-amino acid N-acyltransferase